VEVREHDVLDLHVGGGGVTDVLSDVSARVDDGRDTRLFVSYQVRGMGQAIQLVLLQEHFKLQRTTSYAYYGACDPLGGGWCGGCGTGATWALVVVPIDVVYK
jgi:hypothetical protein